MRIAAALLLLIFVMNRGAIAAPAKPRIPDEIVEVLKTGSDGTLYAIDPSRWKNGEKDVLRRYEVLKTVKLDPVQTQEALLAVRKAVKSYDGNAPSCFEPHHVLRVTSNHHIYDFLICFTCHALVLYEDHALVLSINIGGPSTVLDALLAGKTAP